MIRISNEKKSGFIVYGVGWALFYLFIVFSYRFGSLKSIRATIKVYIKQLALNERYFNYYIFSFLIFLYMLHHIVFNLSSYFIIASFIFSSTASNIFNPFSILKPSRNGFLFKFWFQNHICMISGLAYSTLLLVDHCAKCEHLLILTIDC